MNFRFYSYDPENNLKSHFLPENAKILPYIRGYNGRQYIRLPKSVSILMRGFKSQPKGTSYDKFTYII